VVTKLSGTGADAVFLGICRVAADDDTQLVSTPAELYDMFVWGKHWAD
jgi:hypothetical protein